MITLKEQSEFFGSFVMQSTSWCPSFQSIDARLAMVTSLLHWSMTKSGGASLFLTALSL